MAALKREPKRPPRTHESQREMPDAAGTWWFRGFAIVAQPAGSNIGDTVIEIDFPQRFRVEMVAGAPRIGEADVDHPYGSNVTWLGLWVPAYQS